MRRRQFFLVLSGAAIWPFALEAQQSAPLRRLGILMAYRENDAEASLKTMQQIVLNQVTLQRQAYPPCKRP